MRSKNVWAGNVQKGQWEVQGFAWEFGLEGSVRDLTYTITFIYVFLTWLAGVLGGRRARNLFKYECSRPVDGARVGIARQPGYDHWAR